MKSLLKRVFIIFALMMLASVQLYAQEWSAKQKEVWKNVETYWSLDAKHDIDGFMSYFHDDYSGWYNQDALPSTKAESRQSISNSYLNTKVVYYQIKPVAIKVHDNVAIVHYYYSMALKDAEGKERMTKGNWTDVLMKQGDKWVLIGDHGGPVKKDD